MDTLGCIIFIPTIIAGLTSTDDSIIERNIIDLVRQKGFEENNLEKREVIKQSSSETTSSPSLSDHQLNKTKYIQNFLPQHGAKLGDVSAILPYIDPDTPENVIAYKGMTAIIPCFVNNLGTKQVSWIRVRDIHVLTFGRITFANDARFEAYHEDGTNEWVLRLRYAKMRDSGLYQCQINTRPVISKTVQLEVVDPRAIITAGTDIYLDRGSSLQLTCKVLDLPTAPEYILWHHNHEVADYQQEIVNNFTESILTVSKADVKHSGVYTCSPSNAKEASVKVHVLTGEEPAAMQTNASPSYRLGWGASLCCISAILLKQNSLRRTFQLFTILVFVSMVDFNSEPR